MDAQRQLEPLTGRQRIIFGGLGALSPILLNLLVVDGKTVFVGLTLIVLLTYVARIGVLFYLGGMIAWLHKTEGQAVKAFELGIIAPALITGLVNGANREKHDDPPAAVTTASVSRGATLDGLFVRVAFAQEERVVYSFARRPAETRQAQALRGLLGWSSSGRWFVVLKPSFTTPADAFQAATTLRARTGRPAHVYGPGGPSAGYVVVLGDWLEEAQATRTANTLRGSAIDVYTWLLPARTR